MKKNLFPVLAMFVAVVLSALCFSACQQDEEILSAASSTDDIVIKMSVPASADGLRSTSDYQDIKEGDTVDVYNLQNINILISAESVEGWIIEGDWNIALRNPEKGLLSNDQDLWLSVRPGAYALNKSMVAIKPEKLGVYTVEFKKDDKLFTFYIRHSGLPGDIGDEADGNYSFRMEKNQFITGNTTKNGYTIYLKSDEYIAGNKVKVLVWTGNGSTFTTGNGSLLSAEELTCYKCEYSPGYIYFSFLPSEITPIGGMYIIDFYAGSYGQDWYRPNDIYKSNWSENGQIRFMDMK